MQSTTLENGDSRPFWQGVDEGRLLLQKCRQCGRIQFPPRQICTACWSEDLEWIESRGEGVIESVTIVERAPTPEFRDRVPYPVATVILSEGPRMVTNIVGPDALSAAIDDPVVVTFEPGAAGRVLPQFKRRA